MDKLSNLWFVQSVLTGAYPEGVLPADKQNELLGFLPGDDKLMQADLALCEAKEEGTGLVRFFSPHMREKVRTRQELHAELRRAFDNGEFELHYQPQIRLVDHRVVGMEALLRWRHPSRGLLLPGTFMPGGSTAGRPRSGVSPGA